LTHQREHHQIFQLSFFKENTIFEAKNALTSPLILGEHDVFDEEANSKCTSTA
jgi:hypothetical protein